jgi:hypothetical protein
MESNAWRQPGCLGLIAGLFLGIGVIFFALFSGDTNGIGEGPVAGTTTASTGSGCADATAAFRTGARGSGDGTAAERASSRIRHVCWEPTNELRVDIDYPSDIEAGAEPMLWLCDVATRFIEDSGREWHGFTAYSQARATLGRPVLRKTEPYGSCVNPGRDG